jgi:hypothetical protein
MHAAALAAADIGKAAPHFRLEPHAGVMTGDRDVAAYKGTARRRVWGGRFKLFNGG